MSGAQRVVVTRSVARVITVRLPGRVVTVRQAGPPRVTVVSFGLQGPPGALSDEVQLRLLRAEQSAEAALQVATVASNTVASLMADLQSSFTHYAGAIAAQEG